MQAEWLKQSDKHEHEHKGDVNLHFDKEDEGL